MLRARLRPLGQGKAFASVVGRALAQCRLLCPSHTVRMNCGARNLARSPLWGRLSGGLFGSWASLRAGQAQAESPSQRGPRPGLAAPRFVRNGSRTESKRHCALACPRPHCVIRETAVERDLVCQTPETVGFPTAAQFTIRVTTSAFPIACRRESWALNEWLTAVSRVMRPPWSLTPAASRPGRLEGRCSGWRLCPYWSIRFGFSYAVLSSLAASACAP
jgi:hypothetical protein